jgi:porin
MRMGIAGGAALGLALMFMAALVAGAASADGLDDWLHGETMTGDWGGLRGKLEDAGIELEAEYTAEMAGNPVGGQGQGFRYAHELDFGAVVDLGKLAGLEGTIFTVSFAEYAGQSLSRAEIGNIFAVQEIYVSTPDVRLSELSVEQSLFDDHLELKAGWIDAGSDFAVLPLACNFWNEAFCDNPASLGENSGFTEQPNSSWGGRIKVEFGDFYAQTGAYEVNPSLAKQGNGFKLGTSGATGAFIPVEVGWNPVDALFGLPGQFRIGGYYDTSDVDNVTADVDEDSPPGMHHGRWGLYLLGQQKVYREADNAARGLTVFGGVVFGDSQTAEIQWFVEAGLVYQGTFAGRDDDTVNLGFAYGHINGRLINAQKNANKDEPDSEVEQSAETVIELNYGAQITPWWLLSPGLQVIINPGADNGTPTALVLGLKTALTF